MNVFSIDSKIFKLKSKKIKLVVGDYWETATLASLTFLRLVLNSSCFVQTSLIRRRNNTWDYDDDSDEYKDQQFLLVLNLFCSLFLCFLLFYLFFVLLSTRQSNDFISSMSTISLTQAKVLLSPTPSFNLDGYQNFLFFNSTINRE